MDSAVVEGHALPFGTTIEDLGRRLGIADALPARTLLVDADPLRLVTCSVRERGAIRVGFTLRGPRLDEERARSDRRSDRHTRGPREQAEVAYQAGRCARHRPNTLGRGYGNQSPASMPSAPPRSDEDCIGRRGSREGFCLTNGCRVEARGGGEASVAARVVVVCRCCNDGCRDVLQGAHSREWTVESPPGITMIRNGGQRCFGSGELRSASSFQDRESTAVLTASATQVA
ncbi:Hypothetical protein A7982_00141 [Minicystis rosea]|nr:Hypothetical protein A7982_00141 [Minicystis rosea]